MWANTGVQNTVFQRSGRGRIEAYKIRYFRDQDVGEYRRTKFGISEWANTGVQNTVFQRAGCGRTRSTEGYKNTGEVRDTGAYKLRYSRVCWANTDQNTYSW
jgi:hypothetical protein